MSVQIDYNEEVSAEGRNGMMRQTGIHIQKNYSHDKSGVSLYPVNTKGIGRGMMEIPKSAIPAVIEELKKFT